MSGCRSLAVALAAVLASGCLGSLLGLPSGALGVIVGAVVVPWALVLGTVGWGVVSVPWLVVRLAVPTLPELSDLRAVLGFLLVAPFAAAWAGWFIASTAGADLWVLVVEPVAFGLAAAPFAVVVALFGRDGMKLVARHTAKAAH